MTTEVRKIGASDIAFGTSTATSLGGKVYHEFSASDLPLDAAVGTDVDAAIVALQAALTPEYINFPTPVVPHTNVGDLSWNPTYQTLDLQTTGQTTMQVGQEVVIYGKNNSGVSIANGDAIYISGGTNKFPEFSLADADIESASYVVGMATQDIADGSYGFVTTLGNVNGIRTDGVPVGESWDEGDSLFLSSTAGKLTNTPPSAPKHRVFVAIVTDKKTSATGCLFVKPSIGYELGELHDVAIDTPTNGQVLAYVESTGVWENATVSDTGAVTSVSSADAYIGVSEATPDPVLTLNVGTGANQIVALDATAKLPAVDGSQLTNLPSGFANPMTAVGDIIVGGTAGAATALAAGTDGEVLTLVSGTPSWEPATGGSGAVPDYGLATDPPLDLMLAPSVADATTLMNRLRYCQRMLRTNNNGQAAYTAAMLSYADGSQFYSQSITNQSPPAWAHFQDFEQMMPSMYLPWDQDPRVLAWQVDCVLEKQATNETTTYTSEHGATLALPLGWCPATVYPTTGLGDNSGTYRLDRPIFTPTVIIAAWHYGWALKFNSDWQSWYATRRDQLMAAADYWFIDHFAGNENLYNDTTKLIRQWPGTYEAMFYYYLDIFRATGDMPGFSVWICYMTMLMADMEVKSGQSAADIAKWDDRATDLKEGINTAFAATIDRDPLKYYYYNSFQTYPVATGIPEGWDNTYGTGTVSIIQDSTQRKMRAVVTTGNTKVVSFAPTGFTRGGWYKAKADTFRWKIKPQQTNARCHVSISLGAKTLMQIGTSVTGAWDHATTGGYVSMGGSYSANTEYECELQINYTNNAFAFLVNGTQVGTGSTYDTSYTSGVTRFDYLVTDVTGTATCDIWDMAYGDRISETAGDVYSTGYVIATTGDHGRVPMVSWTASAVWWGILTPEHSAMAGRWLANIYNTPKATGAGTYEYPCFQKATGRNGYFMEVPTPWHERHGVGVIHEIITSSATITYGTFANGGYFGAVGGHVEIAYAMSLVDPVAATDFITNTIADFADDAEAPYESIYADGTLDHAAYNYQLSLASSLACVRRM